MRSNVRRMVGLAFALAVTFAIAALSRVPYEAAGGDQALIRLSWRTSGAQVEECRRPSAEELERLPVHMRRDEICERRIVPYRLLVLVNDRAVYDELIRPAGARADRPLFVFRELPVVPGDYQVEVLWEREDARAEGPGAVDAAASTSARQAQRTTTADRLQLTAGLRLEAGDVSLITYDVDRHALVARGRGVEPPAR